MITVTQYFHYPNNTELGKGNTHECYLLVPNTYDLSHIFPDGKEVEVTDVSNKKKYYLRSAWGREFRINQMGQFYRDYDVHMGDEIILTFVEGEDSRTYISVHRHNRLVIKQGRNGAEIINLERLTSYKHGEIYEIPIVWAEQELTLQIQYKEAIAKRSDSPDLTDYYTVKLGNNILQNGSFFLTLGSKNELTTFEKTDMRVFPFDESIISNSTILKRKTITNPSEIITSTSYLPYLTALRTKPFMLLAGISGTGKSHIVRKLAQATNPKEYKNEEDRWKDNRPENFELIQVKPNWHNSMDVVGYMSNIPAPHYVFTDFVRFIVKAWQHKDTPYFLCLDEMNLAPVEEYFAEFLSAIESRALDENGEYITDPIIAPFKEFAQDVREDMLKQLLGEAHHTEANPLAIQFTEKGLTLPPNLMVMGTVNMDETTFSFSRKVLDRAMSVEMNEVKYDDFLSGKTELIPLLTEWNDKLVNRPQKACEVQEQIDSQKVIDYLKAVNELLDSTPFKLGYRAANEAILYVSACQDFAKDDFNIEKALDEFTLMKILSRIEGDDSRLAIDEKDERLLKAGIEGNALDDGEQSLNLLNCLRAIVRQHIGQDTETEKKINRMYNTLLREHFVSYWG